MKLQEWRGGDWAAVDLGRPEKPQPPHRPDRALRDAVGEASRQGALRRDVGAPPGMHNDDAPAGHVECGGGRGAQRVESSGFGRQRGPRQPPAKSGGEQLLIRIACVAPYGGTAADGESAGAERGSSDVKHLVS